MLPLWKNSWKALWLNLQPSLQMILWWKHNRSYCKLGLSLLLKTKAAVSKEDNPNWWEAIYGPFAVIYRSNCYWGWNSGSNGCMGGCWPNRRYECSPINFGIQAEMFPDEVIKKFKVQFVPEEINRLKTLIFLYLCSCCSMDNRSSNRVEIQTRRYYCYIPLYNLGRRRKNVCGSAIRF